MSEPTRGPKPATPTKSSSSDLESLLESRRALAASLGMEEETYLDGGMILPANGGPPKRVVEKDLRQESDG